MAVQKMLAIAGRDATGKARAIKTDSLGNVGIIEEKNVLLFSQTDTFQIGRHVVFYGNFTRGTTDLTDLTPIDYRNFSKKSVVIQNNFDVDIYVSEIHLYTEIEKNGNRVKVSLDADSRLMIPAGEWRSLSSNDYVELREPFLGIAIKIRAVPSPTEGSITLNWLGGN